MDITAASVVYNNHFIAPNYVGDQLQPQSPQQNQNIHISYVVNSGPGLGLGLGSGHSATMGSGSGLSPRTGYNDLYRFEDGSGDASGSLLIGQHEEDFCETNEEIQISTSSSTTCQAEHDIAKLASDLCLNLTQRGEMTQMVNENQEGNVNGAGVNDSEDDYNSGMGEGGHYQSTMVDTTSFIVYPPALPMSPHSPYMTVGQEMYVFQPETVFVLGMRLNVTKNDIMIFFGKMGLIKLDDITGKPKIFVYKNKLTGRSKGEATITYVNPYSAQAAINCLGGSKFMGQTLTVLPAYLSMRKGTSVRYSYPRDLSPTDLQRRQRLPKWKPASDNWVCLLCRNSNFVWRASCNRCQASKLEASEVQGQPESGLQPEEETSGSPKKDSESLSPRRRRQHKDWFCGFCFNLNFWYRLKCNRCQASRAEALATSESEEPWELVLSPPSAE